MKGYWDYPLERVFRCAQARVIDDMILKLAIPRTEKEIAKATDISSRTLQRILPELTDDGILKRRRDGIAYKYELNLDSDRARGLFEYSRTTVRENLKQSRKK